MVSEPTLESAFEALHLNDGTTLEFSSPKESPTTRRRRRGAHRGPTKISAALAPSVKLTRDNYIVWKTQVLPTLRSHRLADHIEADPPPQAEDPDDDWWNYDQHVMGFLLSSMTEGIIGCVTEASTAKEVWDMLAKDFASSVEARVQELLGKLHTLTKGNTSLEDYIVQFQSICSALAASGERVDQRTMVRALLRGLGAQYAPVISTVRAAAEPMTLGTVISHLRDHEAMLARHQPAKETPEFAPSVNLTHSSTDNSTQGKGKHENSTRNRGRGTGRGGGASRGNGTTRFVPKCQICSRKGHRALECYDRFNRSYVPQDPRINPAPPVEGHGNFNKRLSHYESYARQPPQAYSTSFSIAPSSQWYPDSGATHHVVADPNMLMDAQSYSGQDKIFIGDGSDHKLSPRSERCIFLGYSSHHSGYRSSPQVHVLQTSSVEPSSFSVAMAHPDWRNAMTSEYHELLRNGTWTLVPPLPHARILGCKWVYRLKLHPDGSVDRHKARLVAQGFRQTLGVDFDESFSPVIKIITVHLLLATAVSRGWCIHQLDVSNAFLHGDLQETVYMRQPPGFTHPTLPSHVCLLRKSIYGLKQAPRAWFSKLSAFLLRIGFSGSCTDPSLFFRITSSLRLYLLIYVDDFLVLGSDSAGVFSLIQSLHKAFAIRDLGPARTFLGIQLIPHPLGLALSQSHYLSNILRRANMGQCTCDATLYRQIVGALQYLTLTCPDICYAELKLPVTGTPTLWCDNLGATHLA
ncbi:uncharacterized protein LOC144709063 [Wolffia australiana]